MDTVKEAAAKLNLSENSVRAYCTRYSIGIKKGPIWLLSKSDSDFILSRKGKCGRPKLAEKGQVTP